MFGLSSYSYYLALSGQRGITNLVKQETKVIAPRVTERYAQVLEGFAHYLRKEKKHGKAGKALEKYPILRPSHTRLKCKYSSLIACKRARSLARIKVSAFGAGDRGFKSHRARSIFLNLLFSEFSSNVIVFCK